MHCDKLFGTKLDLFDGDGGAAAAGATATGDTTGTVPGNTHRGKSGEYDNVKFGKQAADSVTTGDKAGQADTGTPAAGETAGVQSTSDALEARKQEYYRLIKGEYKDLFAQDTQRILNDRFKDHKTLEKRVQDTDAIINLMMQRYGIHDGDVSKLATAFESDTAYWESVADEEGMTVENYMRMKKLERDNAAYLEAERRRQGQESADRQLALWAEQEQEAKKTYPSFDLQAELANDQFRFLITNAKSPVSLQHAYEVVHMDEIKAGIAQMQAKATEKQVVDSIRARGARPIENGISSQSAFTVKDDVSKLSGKDMAEINRRVMRGERVSFG
jgi:hypothetical protein